MSLVSLGKALLNEALPKPIIPQKRYLVLAGIIIYYAAKAYVSWTPSPEDDSYPDKAKHIVLKLVGVDDGYKDSEDDGSNDNLRYGEEN